MVGVMDSLGCNSLFLFLFLFWRLEAVARSDSNLRVKGVTVGAVDAEAWCLYRQRGNPGVDLRRSSPLIAVLNPLFSSRRRLFPAARRSLLQ